jgi:hypothetical protein
MRAREFIIEDQPDNPDSWESQAADQRRDVETARMSAQDAKAGGVAEAKRKKKSSRSTRGYFFPGYGYYGSGDSGEGGGGDGGGESVNRGMAEGINQDVAEGSLNEFVPSGNSASSYYAVTENFINEFTQQKQEELQDLIDAGWTKQDLAQAGTLQGQAADIAHLEQVRDGFLKGLKPGFDAYLRGDTQMKDQLGEYWLDNNLPLNQDWGSIYGEPWGDDGLGEGVAEDLDEAVGGNYLYHATSASGLKGMLSSGGIRSATGPQAATQAQTKLPTVSVTRDWGYASGSNAANQMVGIARHAVLVLDRNAVESNFKTLGTSQSTNIKGLSFNPYLKKDGETRSQNTDLMARANAKGKAKYAEPTAKAGGEFEEAVVVPKGALPLKGTMVGFWVNPKSELMKDPAIMNDPRRLDMVRPNQFVKATQQQGVAEGDLNEKSTSQAQFRTMAAAAHNPKFAKKVGISRDVAREFHGADKKSNYKSLPKKAAEDASWGMAPEGRGYKK